ncbi:dephospho-CoA kinase [Flavobacterium sp. Sd200]|uniref:dephospho-CoA kinase n=1 Tax=Flavobacterium sp. Sd200 TaxID=2692211 RepID=UPI0013686940|nr:dephospho-CoA kinase [Flavobacterium sp. Sd200]MXN90054.1 dephospho-CoA kinase [Flavobacterium sp. Sd200]
MKTKIIGLTGGIGSGKTTIARYFESLGIPVYIADDEAKKILYTPEVVAELVEKFGNNIFTDGIPDRTKIAEIVFKQPEKLAVLNSIIHPKVGEHFKKWITENTGKLFVIKETAILFESGSYKDCDAVILVTAPIEVRVDRVMQRDGVTKDKVLERMANQWDDEKKAALSNYIIDNTDLESAKKQVVKIVKLVNSL